MRALTAVSVSLLQILLLLAGTTTTASAAAGDPIGNLDSVRRVPEGIAVQGWAIDPDTVAPIDVHIYLSSFAGVVRADRSRPDVAAAYPAYGDRHGFAATMPAGPGSYRVCAYASNVGPGSTNPVIGCRTLVVSNAPFGNVDTIRRVPGGVELAGWVIDPNTVESTDVHLYIDGHFSGIVAANGARPDVAGAFPGYGDRHGFHVALPVATGRFSSVCVYAINRGPGTVNPLLTCAIVDFTGRPTGSIDFAQGTSAQSMTVAGWAMDLDTAESIEIHIYVDGSFHRVSTADALRPDVAAVYPAYGAAHGFQVDVVSRRDQHVCVYAINRSGLGHNVLLGCRIDPTTGRPPPPGVAVPAFVSAVRNVVPSDYGNAWRPGCPLGPESLLHLTVSYWGFDGAYHEGGIVAHWGWAYHIATVFHRLYDERFQLQRVEPITHYAGPGDVTPDRQNVTSAFVCRPVTGGGGWSEHSYGWAVDINPVQNPYVNGGLIVPDPEGRDYLNRGQVAPGVVNGAVTSAFASIGWYWGGNWRGLEDYMHFSGRNG